MLRKKETRKGIKNIVISTTTDSKLIFYELIAWFPIGIFFGHYEYQNIQIIREAVPRISRPEGIYKSSLLPKLMLPKIIDNNSFPDKHSNYLVSD